jgi:hypothetical protein
MISTVTELFIMDVDKETSPSRALNDTSPGDSKAVAPIRICQACDKCRIEKAKCACGMSMSHRLCPGSKDPHTPVA